MTRWTFLSLIGIWILVGTACQNPADAEGSTDSADRPNPRVAQQFPEFFPPNVPHSIPLNEIEHGGPPKDGIPALTDPEVLPAAAANYLRPDDIVLGLEHRGQARAYPLRILNWHEIVNDSLGGERVLITYCPLCGTGIAFDPRVEGKPLEFGVSGLLHNSDLLMYDRNTDRPSLWQQALGEAVVGPRTGTRLKMLPVVHARWKDWKRQHPDTTVLSTNTGYPRDYNRDPYAGYAQTDRLFFPVRGASSRLPAKTLVFGLIAGGRAKAYPLGLFADRAVLNDTVGNASVVLIAEAGDPPAVRAYRRDGRRFSGTAQDLRDAQGNRWRLDESALIGPNGERLKRLADGFVAFWFAWSAFYPHTELYTAPEEARPEQP